MMKFLKQEINEYITSNSTILFEGRYAKIYQHIFLTCFMYFQLYYNVHITKSKAQVQLSMCM